VDVAKRSGGEATTEFGMLILASVCQHLSIELLHICGGDFADLLVSKLGIDVVVDVAAVVLQRGRAHGDGGVFVQPDVQPRGELHTAVFTQLGTVVLIDALVQLFEQFLKMMSGKDDIFYGTNKEILLAK